MDALVTIAFACLMFGFWLLFFETPRIPLLLWLVGALVGFVWLVLYLLIEFGALPNPGCDTCPKVTHPAVMRPHAPSDADRDVATP